MKLSFTDNDEKEEYIQEHSKYDRKEDMEYFFCPFCHKRYDDIDDAVECCQTYPQDEDDDF